MSMGLRETVEYLHTLPAVRQARIIVEYCNLDDSKPSRPKSPISYMASIDVIHEVGDIIEQLSHIMYQQIKGFGSTYDDAADSALVQLKEFFAGGHGEKIGAQIIYAINTEHGYARRAQDYKVREYKKESV